ncbi:MAG: GNAT family N-acetyltransferase [Tepidisphaeraceae bacterium]|jgi:ribosomal protein S18 acetylase RimI-like enzyme
MKIIYRDDLAGIDWQKLKAALTADQFDNGRTPEQLKTSFQNSHGVCIAWSDGHVIGTARVLSDGVCNAYLIDVWTQSNLRRRGVAREMISRPCVKLAGQHIYLQVDGDAAEFYRRLGFVEQPVGMSRIVGRWLVNESE